MNNLNILFFLRTFNPEEIILFPGHDCEVKLMYDLVNSVFYISTLRMINS